MLSRKVRTLWLTFESFNFETNKKEWLLIPKYNRTKHLKQKNLEKLSARIQIIKSNFRFLLIGYNQSGPNCSLISLALNRQLDCVDTGQQINPVDNGSRDAARAMFAQTITNYSYSVMECKQNMIGY